jgi:Domain of unknown function (DUF4249)
MKTIGVLLSIVSLVAWFGCKEPTSPDEYSDQVVLNAYLFAGQSIDSVFVQRTARILEFYSDDAVALTGASVAISLMRTDNPAAVETTYTLKDDPAVRGRYFSPAIVLPKRIYTIAVQVNGYPTVTGVTSVPDTFRVITTVPPIVKWDPSQPPLEASWTPSSNYSDYVTAVRSLDPNAPIIDDFRSRNRAVDDPKPDRTGFFFNIPNHTSLEVPWLAFSYLGRHLLYVSAVDENYYNFLRQIAGAQGGTIREIRYNLNGGLGVFASAAVSKNPITITLVQ